MKKILITGANSYIGTSFERYMDRWKECYKIDTLDMIGGAWKEKSFSGYDTVYHVAGIAHADNGKISSEKAQLYYSINTDLAIEVAKKAKLEGVKQFVFMSSSIVYGSSAPIGKKRIISADTPVSPENCYGDSKIKAEKGIMPLSTDSFKVVILRPPMIYGPKCKGNYRLLSKIANALPIFPLVNNERSMLYIDNLMEFVKLIIDNEDEGVFWPQNKEYTNTSELVKLIAKAKGRNIYLIKGYTRILKLLGHLTNYVNKAFGNFVYEQNMSVYSHEYRLCSLEESIQKTER